MGLWTKEHFQTIIPAFLIFAVIAVLARIWLGKKSESVRRIPLQAIATVLIILEVMKQINSASDGSYDLYSLPFHYCSLFLYLLPLHAFYRGRYSKYVNAAALGTLASLFLMMLLTPTVIYSADNILNYFNGFGSFHTVTFHNLVPLYFLLTLSLDIYEFNVKRDMKVMAIFLAIYVVIATALSFALNVNFHNLLKCNLGIIENVRLMLMDKLGAAIGHGIYIVILFIMTIVFAYAAYFLTKLVMGIFAKKKTAK